ncbi:MAG TPA: hypothetical protein VGT61_12950 [Thermomicrobiales bacterium]|jgi:hypothetical protein|nr:hypothetical protein [Thermomicrobiales bacterium]
MSDPITDDGVPGEAPVIDHGTALVALQSAFADYLDADENDVEILPDQGDTEDDIAVAGETWTLYLSGWPGPRQVFVAIEDEPEDGASPDEVEAAWRAVVPDHVLAAIRVADDELGGEITASLMATGDPVSMGVAAAVRSTPGA